MRRRLGIGARIAGGSFVIALVICTLAGFGLDLRIQHILRSSSEAVLASEAAPYAEGVRQEPDEEVDPPGPSQEVAVIAPDGTTRLDTLPPELLAAVSAREAPASTEVVVLGSPASIVRIEPVTTSEGVWRIVSARPAADERAVLSQMRLLLALALGVIAIGVLVTALVLTNASLGPVRRIRRTAERLTEEPGDELLPVGPAEDEVARLARTLNELILSLRASARRERQLVSDASHELRTPLAILRARLELARTGSHDEQSLLEDLAGAERAAERLSDLVASLLELSRIEASQSGTATAEELLEEARDAVDRAALRAGDAVDVRLRERAAPAAGSFAVSAQDMGRALDNLLSNALRAVDGAGRITVSLTIAHGALTLDVVDTGGGMPPEFVPHALERFRQGDESRAGGSGAGLGLAIVAAIVERADGTISLDNRPGEGLRVRLALPGA